MGNALWCLVAITKQQLRMMNVKRLSRQTSTDFAFSCDGRADVLISQYTFLNNYRNREKIFNLLLVAKLENVEHRVNRCQSYPEGICPKDCWQRKNSDSDGRRYEYI